MKIFNLINTTLLILFSAVSHAQLKQIEPQQLLNEIQNNKILTIFDVRSEAEFAQGHIQGAINIPYDQIGQYKDKLSAYKDHNVVLYCRSGRRAQIAAAALQRLGLSQLVDLNGHLLLWQKLHYPLVSNQD